MKKIIVLAAAICALCACNKEGGNGSDAVVTKVEVVCNVASISNDILDNYDIYYDYTDFEGKKHSDKLTGKTSITFSKANPGLSDVNSNPFTVALRVVKLAGATPKTSYDTTYSIEIGLDGYYENGELATDSYNKGSNPLIRKSTKGTLPDDLFHEECEDIAEEAITYEIFHCKTITGEWHIGVQKKK